MAYLCAFIKGGNVLQGQTSSQGTQASIETVVKKDRCKIQIQKGGTVFSDLIYLKLWIQTNALTFGFKKNLDYVLWLEIWDKP